MRKISYRPYVFLLLFFLSVMSLPQGVAERIRSAAVASFSPGWRGLNFLREQTVCIATLSLGKPSGSTPVELEQLSQENHLLRSQMESVREWLLNEDRLQKQMQRYQFLSSQADKSDFFKRRSQELKDALDLQLSSLFAKVIFRQPASWSSSVWINVGENDNRRLGKQVVCKNSPVVLGSSIVGVVEYVGDSQSRVRLLTDSSLVISVRSVRGELQNRHLLDPLETILFALEARSDLLESDQDKKVATQLLSRLKQNLLASSGDLYLAKGELKGSSAPLWRSRGCVLKGLGFNYDFPDAEGPARDLRSGEPYGQSGRGDPVRLLQWGDLLVTTGLDGLFPAGFHVATVSSVQMLKEGASSYEIQAVPTAGDLETLSYVFVLPPYR